MDKKEILKQLEVHFGEKPKYKGAPSFAYEIEAGDEVYTIDRTGKITTATGVEVELEGLLNGPKAEKATEINEEANPTELLEIEVVVPMEGHTGLTLKNLVNMIYSKQVLIKKALELEDDIVNADFITGVNKAEIQTLEDFKAAVADVGITHCRGIRFDFEGNTITFTFCNNHPGLEKLETYTQFAALLDKNAKAQKHASSKPTETDNEKFTMRTWLLRLGFIGPDFKKAREDLLKNLSGNGAFRKVKPADDLAEQKN